MVFRLAGLEGQDEVRDGGHRLARLPGLTLRRAAHVMMAELAGRLGGLDLKISDATVLLLVEGRRGMTSSEIGRQLDIRRANMVPLLNRLASAGLIEREPIDRKSQTIVLSAAGQEKPAQVQAVITAFEAGLMERIPPQHRDHFLPALNALSA